MRIGSKRKFPFFFTIIASSECKSIPEMKWCIQFRHATTKLPMLHINKRIPSHSYNINNFNKNSIANEKRIFLHEFAHTLENAVMCAGCDCIVGRNTFYYLLSS